MQVQACILCEAVSVREGLLFLLAGGVQRLYAETFPAAIPLCVGGLIEYGAVDELLPHEFTLQIVDADSEELGRIVTEVPAGGNLEPDQVSLLPFGVHLHGIAVPSAGDYEIRLLVDGERDVAMALEVLQAPSLTSPKG